MIAPPELLRGLLYVFMLILSCWKKKPRFVLTGSLSTSESIEASRFFLFFLQYFSCPSATLTRLIVDIQFISSVYQD